MEKKVSRPTPAGKPPGSPCTPLFPNFAAIAEQAALDGLYVLPACLDPKEKHPAIRWKEFERRKPTQVEIVAWIAYFWTRNGLYVTGPVLGRFVVDCDDVAAIHWARRQGLPRTQTLLTRRGRHFHFRWPEGVSVKNSESKIHHHVDIRGLGGVAVAAGSIHDTGFRYRWARGCSPEEAELARAPEWLLDWLREDALRREVPPAARAVKPRPFPGMVGAWAAAVIAGELDRLRNAIAHVNRNSELASVAYKLGQLAGGDEADADELLDILHEAVAPWVDEVEKSADTIKRCFAAGIENPRSAPPIRPVQILSKRWSL
jgi:hypothetical protein